MKMNCRQGLPSFSFFEVSHYHFWLILDAPDLEGSNGYVYENILKPQPSADPNDPLVFYSLVSGIDIELEYGPKIHVNI